MAAALSAAVSLYASRIRLPNPGYANITPEPFEQWERQKGRQEKLAGVLAFLSALLGAGGIMTSP